jgi:hypothetical protein
MTKHDLHTVIRHDLKTNYDLSVFHKHYIKVYYSMN